MKREFFIITIGCLIILYLPFILHAEDKNLYRVSRGDVITIDVINEPGLKTTTRIASDGTITFPYIGVIHVEGMTLKEIEDTIATELSKGYINYPVVSVSLTQSKGRKVFVYGEVKRPGMILYEEDLTVLETLSMAGGVTSDGLYGRIKVRRKDKEGEYKDIVESRLNEGVIEDKEVENTILEADDIVVVERNETFYVYGEVNRPGEYVLKGNMTVLRAITIAGGFTKWGSPRRVKILRTRSDQKGYVIIKVDLESAIKGDQKADILLKPDDVIIASSGIL